MSYLQYLVFIGALVQIIGVASYINETLKGHTKPNRVTWLLWSLSPLIATAAALSNGVRWSVLPVFMSGFGPLLVLAASFVNKKSFWQIKKLDYFCGILSILALVLWAITKNPNIAIIFAVLSDALAGIPTLIKCWQHPQTESIEAYTTGAFNAFTSFAAISLWNFSSLAFPVYLIIANSSMIFALLHRRS